MPYKLSEDGLTVMKEDGDEVPGGKHDTHEQALDHLRALEANVGGDSAEHKVAVSAEDEELAKRALDVLGATFPELYIPFVKYNEVTGEVSGWATIEQIDRTPGTPEVMDYASSRPEFIAWSDEVTKDSQGRSAGNLRAMHDDKHVAGIIKQLTPVDHDKGIWITAAVIDPVDKEKCIKGAYTGFSVGGRYKNRWFDPQLRAYRYTAQPGEISLVDRPCVPGAVFQFIKNDGSCEVCELGKAMPVTIEQLTKDPLGVVPLLHVVKETWTPKEVDPLAATAPTGVTLEGQFAPTEAKTAQVNALTESPTEKVTTAKMVKVVHKPKMVKVSSSVAAVKVVTLPKGEVLAKHPGHPDQGVHGNRGGMAGEAASKTARPDVYSAAAEEAIHHARLALNDDDLSQAARDKIRPALERVENAKVKLRGKKATGKDIVGYRSALAEMGGGLKQHHNELATAANDNPGIDPYDFEVAHWETGGQYRPHSPTSVRPEPGRRMEISGKHPVNKIVKVVSIAKGDSPGHPFHGNQHTGEAAGAGNSSAAKEPRVFNPKTGLYERSPEGEAAIREAGLPHQYWHDKPDPYHAAGTTLAPTSRGKKINTSRKLP